MIDWLNWCLSRCVFLFLPYLGRDGPTWLIYFRWVENHQLGAIMFGVSTLVDRCVDIDSNSAGSPDHHVACFGRALKNPSRPHVRHPTRNIQNHPNPKSKLQKIQNPNSITNHQHLFLGSPVFFCSPKKVIIRKSPKSPWIPHPEASLMEVEEPLALEAARNYRAVELQVLNVDWRICFTNIAQGPRIHGMNGIFTLR